ncbi:hypothetical protein GCM10007424_03390 [Flavobacterium suaedae]|uniref:Oxidoreductase n=1 Tax=Flavobacterium suaedae TaxID=1767027 RepID=A0ABQ1JE97_9FLAO|nr:oxidoreductase [Flavobacterium suaedae]GGB66745.1 hypothetical protein GCM10007424_03390 [Flavobacterium suaedae]
MKQLFFILSVLVFIGCKENHINEVSFSEVTVDTLLQDDISIRAITIDNDKVWYAGSNGKWGRVSLNGEDKLQKVITQEQDSILPEFRAIAQNKHNIFIINVASPAMLYKIDKKDGVVTKVYTEEGEKVFYDSMQFYNDKEGIAMGDPTNECLSVIKTTDGGETWHKISCDALPNVAEGEAGFAASDTNVIVKGDNTWIVSGGKKSRVFYSADKGESWEVFDTPIVQGSAMTGIFSADFYDENIGFAVGGDYEQQNKNSGNKILTTDGGKTWILVGQNTGFGYASCVQFIPASDGYELLACGPAGVFYSYDRGKSWKKVHNDTALHTLRFADNKTVIAAGRNKIIKLTLK